MDKIFGSIFVMLLSALGCLPAFAGNEIGSGGWVCESKTKDGVKVELLDFFEGRNSDGYVYPTTEVLGDLPDGTRQIPEDKMAVIRAQLKDVFDLLTTIYPSYFEGINQTLELVLSHYELLPPEASPHVNRIDFEPILGCDVQLNVAVNPNALPAGVDINEENYRNIQFKTRHIKRMQLLNITGLFAHEILAIWTARDAKGGAITTNLARRVNAKAFAALFGDNPDFTKETFAEWLKFELGTNWTDSSPNRCMIYDAQIKFKGMASQPIVAKSALAPRYYSQITAGIPDAQNNWHWTDRALYAPKLPADVSLDAKLGKIVLPMQRAPYYYSYYYTTVYEEIGQVSRDGNMYTPSGKKVGSLVIKDATIRNNANGIIGHFRGCRTLENTYFDPLGFPSDRFPTPLARAAAAAYTLLFTSKETHSVTGSGTSQQEAMNAANALAGQSCGSADGIEYRAIIIGLNRGKLVHGSGFFMRHPPYYSSTASYICVPK